MRRSTIFPGPILFQRHYGPFIDCNRTRTEFYQRNAHADRHRGLCAIAAGGNTPYMAALGLVSDIISGDKDFQASATGPVAANFAAISCLTANRPILERPWTRLF